MRVLRTAGVIGAAAMLLAGAALAQGAKKPKVVIVATGGTIAGSAATGTEAGYTSGAVGVDVLIQAVPQLKEIAEVSGEQIASIGSQDMTDAVWIKLARRVNEVLADPSVAGVVITHGTDTMAETARTLHAAGLAKTVVLTGAMVPYAFGSSDGLFNLGSALSFAQVLPPGVYVAMNGRCFPGDRVRKNRESGIFERL